MLDSPGYRRHTIGLGRSLQLLCPTRLKQETCCGAGFRCIPILYHSFGATFGTLLYVSITPHPNLYTPDLNGLFIIQLSDFIKDLIVYCFLKRFYMDMIIAVFCANA